MSFSMDVSSAGPFEQFIEPSSTKNENMDLLPHQNDINIVINIDSSGTAVSYSVVSLETLHTSAQILPAEGSMKMSCSSCRQEHNLLVYTDATSLTSIPSVTVKPEAAYELQLETSLVKEEPWDDGAFETELIEEENSSDTVTPQKSSKKKKQVKPKEAGLETNASAQCDLCEKQFSSVSSLKKHKKQCGDSTEKEFACKDCKKTYPRLAQLRAHERHCLKEKRGDPICNLCNKKFTTWHSVYQHLDHIHYKIKSHICHECGKQFRSQKEVDEHLLRHQNTRPYECDLCQKRFPSRISIRHHIIINHIESAEGIVWCYQCNPPKKLLNQKRLQLHQAKHQTAKNYPCPQCSRTFKNEANIKAHTYRFHVPMELKQKYICEKDNCTFVTTVKAQYINHQYVHVPDSEKPFQCDYCGKGFINRNLKVRHERIHTGDRPFPCETCGKAFRSRDDLKVHLRLHTGDKPYSCSICDQRFSDRGCYRSHILIHEKQMNVTLSKSVRKFDKSYTVPLMLD